MVRILYEEPKATENTYYMLVRVYVGVFLFVDCAARSQTSTHSLASGSTNPRPVTKSDLVRVASVEERDALHM